MSKAFYDLEFAPPGTKFTDKDYVDTNCSRSADFVPMCPKDQKVTAKNEGPQLSLVIITCALQTNKKTRSYMVMLC